LSEEKKISVFEHPSLPTSLATTIQRGSILPIHLEGLGLAEQKNHMFCWRWGTRPGDSPSIRMLTIEPAVTPDQGERLGALIIPMDLYASDDFYEGIDKLTFAVVQCQGYKVVCLQTIEEASPVSPTRGEIYPGTFAGCNGYSTGINNFLFNWRWVDSLRVVTLENFQE